MQCPHKYHGMLGPNTGPQKPAYHSSLVYSLSSGADVLLWFPSLDGRRTERTPSAHELESKRKRVSEGLQSPHKYHGILAQNTGPQNPAYHSSLVCSLSSGAGVLLCFLLSVGGRTERTPSAHESEGLQSPHKIHWNTGTK